MPAAFLARKLQNTQLYKNHFISPCVYAQQYLLRIGAQPIRKRKLIVSMPFLKQCHISFTTQLGCRDRSKQHRKQTLPLGFTHEVLLSSSRCCENVLKMSGDISAYFIFIIPRKQNLSTPRSTDLRNSIGTGLRCSETRMKPNHLAGLWLSCFFPIDFVWQG